MNNKQEIIKFQPTVEIRREVFISTEEYLNLMGCDKNWAVDIDISISAHIFGINIAVYKNDKNKNFIEFIYSIISNENKDEIPLLILINENENHFELIKPKIENNYNITHIDEDNRTNSNNDLKNKNHPQNKNYKNLNIIDNKKILKKKNKKNNKNIVIFQIIPLY